MGQMLVGLFDPVELSLHARQLFLDTLQARGRVAGRARSAWQGGFGRVLDAIVTRRRRQVRCVLSRDRGRRRQERNERRCAKDSARRSMLHIEFPSSLPISYDAQSTPLVHEDSMSYGSQNPWPVNRGAATAQAGYDVGLRQHMLRVYNYMASGLALTGLVAYLAVDTGFYAQIYRTPLMFVVMLAPLIMVFVLAARINRMSFAAAQATFWAYAALMGLSMASIFLRYTNSSIAETFFIAAGTFLSMSLYGYTTKADLSKMGSFLVMGLFGIIIAMLVNFFLASPALQFAISVLGVLIFIGLTAWDTQRIKEQYYDGAQGDVMAKQALMGALTLYLDFLNLFLFLLQFMGTRRD
jgi:FtsH-binding integral membrane protein